MDFIPTLPSFASDTIAKTVLGWFRTHLTNEDGVAFYKYPNVGGPHTPQPDLTIVTRTFQPLVIKCLDLRFEQVIDLNADTWKIRASGKEETIDSPILETEDIAVGMQEKFERERPLRKTFKVRPLLATPLLNRAETEARFGDQNGILWDAVDVPRWLERYAEPLTDEQWRLAQSVIQAAVPLTKRSGPRVLTPPANFGEALAQMETDIALLDMDQQYAATQIPPGPQRIRGLAGTGKTVLLALKAANIHRQFPDAKILFTFNTQSLYNQARRLISRFYRHFSGVEPDFDDKLHVRHAWGGKSRAGVYSDSCKRAGIQPLDFVSARGRDRSSPFRACCADLLSVGVKPFYDYTLIDEGQDFPKEFFQVIYSLTKGEASRPIYFAYDELQSLSAIEVPSSTELFGSDANGLPLVSLDGEYPGPIDKDFVLHKSYRCPRDILMIAHAFGLGLYRPKGPVQMLTDVTSWQSIGYEVEGNLRVGETVAISRPSENSPNRIGDIYPSKPIFESRRFNTRDEELDSVAAQIEENLALDGVKAEEIVVTSLDSRSARTQMALLQEKLWKLQIGSIIPGFSDDQADFAESGRITLATIFRAKGNEAPIVYILNFDSLFDYVEEIGNRNAAFTAISRSKAWVRISGIGNQMLAVEQELAHIRKSLPRFTFVYPDMTQIRKLDAETSKRKKEVRKANDMAAKLGVFDVEAIRKVDPAILETLRRKLAEAIDDTK
jgi:superfamily I DNA and RNA helicase